MGFRLRITRFSDRFVSLKILERSTKYALVLMIMMMLNRTGCLIR